MPVENPLLPPHDDDSDDDLTSDSPPINDIVYNIRDKDLICALSLIRCASRYTSSRCICISMYTFICICLDILSNAYSRHLKASPHFSVRRRPFTPARTSPSASPSYYPNNHVEQYVRTYNNVKIV